MRISYRLDQEAGIDAVDPLGEILFSNDSGKSITIGPTYIDAWLAELLSGSQDLLVNGYVVISILEEPKSLYLTLKSPDLILQWGDTEIIGILSDFLESLQSASKRFVDEMKSTALWENNPAIEEIERLMEQLAACGCRR